MNNKYSTIDTSLLELENANVANIVNARVNEAAHNRADKRKIMKALSKMENREQYFSKKQSKESSLLRKEYQKELDKRVENCKEQVTDGLIDNWKKSTALAAIVLKRKYNWNVGRIQTFIQKVNDLHIEMLESGEWDDVLQILDDECDIQLEVTE